MAQYQILQSCYLPHRGGLRHFNEGNIVDLDPDDLASISHVDNYVQPVKFGRVTYGGRVKVSRKDINFSSASAMDKVVADLTATVNGSDHAQVALTKADSGGAK